MKISQKIKEQREEIKMQEKVKSAVKAESESEEVQIEDRDYIMDDEKVERKE